MVCIKCGNKAEEKTNLCSTCIVQGHSDITVKSVATGDNSVNVGVGSDNMVIIDKFEANLNSKNSKKVIYEIVNKGKGIQLNTLRRFKNFNLILGIISNIITVGTPILGLLKVGFFGELENYMLLSKFIPFSLLILFTGIYFHLVYSDLKKKKFSWLQPIKIINLKLKRFNNIISSIKIKGICPKCAGKVKLRKNEERIIGYCENNNDHKFDFDHTDFKGKEN